MAGHPMIEDYLADLSDQLPFRGSAEVLAELRAGLLDALDAHPASTTDPTTAAYEILAEFGAPHVVAAAYAPQWAADQGRRTGRLTLTALPAVGGLWAAALPLGSPPHWRDAPWLPLAEHLLAAGVAITAGCALIAILTAGRASRYIPHPRVPTLAASAAGCTLAAATGVVLTLTTVRAITAPTSLDWPAVAVAAGATAAILTVVHHFTRRCLISLAPAAHTPKRPTESGAR